MGHLQLGEDGELFEIGMMGLQHGIFLGVSTRGAGRFVRPIRLHEASLYFPNMPTPMLARLVDFINDQISERLEPRAGFYNAAMLAADGENDVYICNDDQRNQDG